MLADDDVVRVLGEAHESNREKQQEMVRHNTAMETMKREEIDIERERLKSLSWKRKNDELEYMSNMMDKYKTFKHVHGLSDKRILRLYPDMKAIIEAFNEDDDDNDEDNDI